MSDYPMLISNKLHSFRNFARQNIGEAARSAKGRVVGNNRRLPSYLLQI